MTSQTWKVACSKQLHGLSWSTSVFVHPACLLHSFFGVRSSCDLIPSPDSSVPGEASRRQSARSLYIRTPGVLQSRFGTGPHLQKDMTRPVIRNMSTYMTIPTRNCSSVDAKLSQKNSLARDLQPFGRKSTGIMGGMPFPGLIQGYRQSNRRPSPLWLESTPGSLHQRKRAPTPARLLQGCRCHE